MVQKLFLSANLNENNLTDADVPTLPTRYCTMSFFSAISPSWGPEGPNQTTSDLSKPQYRLDPAYESFPHLGSFLESQCRGNIWIVPVLDVLVRQASCSKCRPAGHGFCILRKLVQSAQRQVVDVYGGEEIGHGSEQCDILSMDCSGLPRHWV